MLQVTAHHVSMQHHELSRLVLKLRRAIPLPLPPVPQPLSLMLDMYPAML